MTVLANKMYLISLAYFFNYIKKLYLCLILMLLFIITTRNNIVDTNTGFKLPPYKNIKVIKCIFIYYYLNFVFWYFKQSLFIYYYIYYFILTYFIYI